MNLIHWIHGKRVVYRCGNCGESFKNEEELHAHQDPVCPLVAIERQVANWNRRHGPSGG